MQAMSIAISPRDGTEIDIHFERRWQRARWVNSGAALKVDGRQDLLYPMQGGFPEVWRHVENISPKKGI